VRSGRIHRLRQSEVEHLHRTVGADLTLVERGLRSELRARPAKATATIKRIKWVTVDGGLPPGLDVADRAAMIDRLHRR